MKPPIAGFPNVGKSTLLRQITNAEPEVADYPFTTKGIQIGHFELRWQKYQIIDTPGLLDRPVQDMNPIELNAMVALEHLADLILFIFDPSQTSGFPVENQVNLYWEIKQIFRNTPILPLLNKMDLVEDEDNVKYIQEHIYTEDELLMVAASEGTGISLIVEKLQEFNRKIRDK
jgi:nucleolar GTP-binding protein